MPDQLSRDDRRFLAFCALCAGGSCQLRGGLGGRDEYLAIVRRLDRLTELEFPIRLLFDRATRLLAEYEVLEDEERDIRCQAQHLARICERAKQEGSPDAN